MTPRRDDPPSPSATAGDRQISPWEFALRMRSIAASSYEGDQRRMLALRLIKATLASQGYGAGLAAFAELERRP